MRRITLLALALLLGSGAATLADEPPTAVDLSRDRVLYVVGYAHLDTQWRWDYPTTIRLFVPATLRDNFALFEKFPDYVFNFTGSSRFELMEEYFPAEFETLRRYVAEGRWHVVGSSVDEGDVNVPSPESLIRQVLYGNGYFRKTFGKESIDFLLPDCFGFPASLPSTLAHCGIRGFVTQKLTWGSAVGIPFNVGVWEGPDGHQVVAVLNPGSYVHRLRSDLSSDETWIQRIQDAEEESGVPVDYHFYGVGDQGGAPDPESVEWLQKSVNGEGPLRVIAASSQQIFQDLTEQQISRLPRYKGDLLLTEHSAGTLTSQTAMKRWNRQNELLADAAEKASVVADWLGSASYPFAELLASWTLVLKSQMHDILPGTSIPSAYRYSWNDELLALNGFSSVLTHAVGGVARALDTRSAGMPVVVFNPLSIEREDVARLLVPTDRSVGTVRVLGPDGREVPSQTRRTAGGPLEVLFLARMPALGFAVFEVLPSKPTRPDDELSLSDRSLENARYRVEIDAAGDISRILDKELGRNLLSAPLRLAFLADSPAQWPAWNMDWDDVSATPRTFVSGEPTIRVAEEGPVRVALEITRESLDTRVVQTIRLARGDAGDRVEIDTLIDWDTRGHCLKAVFPLAARSRSATYDMGLGAIERPGNEPKKYEVPSHQWMDLTQEDGSFGVSILDDSRFGADKPAFDTLRLTLVRTPEATSYGDQATQDIGVHEVLYAIAGHRGDWRQGNTPWIAARLNQPLATFLTPPHEGPLGRSHSFLRTSKSQVAVKALKKAEAGQGVIVRIQELTGREASKVRLAAGRGIVSATEVDGQERPIGPGSIRDGEVVFDVEGFGLRTFHIELAPAEHPLAPPSSTPVVLPYDRDVVSRNGESPGGDFDGTGRSLPAEMLGSEIRFRGLRHRLASPDGGGNNALVCKGQKVRLPEGDHDRLVLLAAATTPDVQGTFVAGGRSITASVPPWTGFFGQWDDRVWQDGDVIGLRPGFVRKATVAWTCSHVHEAGEDVPYQRSYLHEIEVPLPEGCREVTLPDDARILVLAATATRNPNAMTVAGHPLSDTLDHVHKASRPYVVREDGSLGGGLFLDEVKIELASVTEDASFVYTLDGSEPGPESPRLDGALVLDEPVILRARTLARGMRPSSVLERRFERTTPLLPVESPGDLAPGLRFDAYEGEGWDKLPDFDVLEPVKSGTASAVDLSPRTRDDDFALRFRGYIEIPRRGIYAFSLSSDDGSRLLIGGQLVIDNDGLHGASEKRGFIALEKGLHSIEVCQFEKKGDEALLLAIEGPDIEKQSPPETMLFHVR
jgi:alpha-mannosidase